MMSLFRSVTPAIPPCPRGPCGMQDFGLVPGSVRHLEGLHVSTGLRFGTLPSGHHLIEDIYSNSGALWQHLCTCSSFSSQQEIEGDRNNWVLVAVTSCLRDETHSCSRGEKGSQFIYTFYLYRVSRTYHAYL